MKRYVTAEQELKALIKTIFSQNETPYNKHPQWASLEKLAGEITEITDLEMYASEDPAMVALCRPVFMAGAKVDRMFESDWAYHKKIETISFKHRPWIVYSDLLDLEALPIELESLEKIHAIFDRIIARGNGPWHLVCGPITTGGLGSRNLNLDIFHQHIVAETKKGFQVFNQMPFERKLLQISSAYPEQFTDTSNPILDIIYLPQIKARKFERVKMIPGWETSKGATQEHDQSILSNINVEFLAPLKAEVAEMVESQ